MIFMRDINLSLMVGPLYFEKYLLSLFIKDFFKRLIFRFLPLLPFFDHASVFGLMLRFRVLESIICLLPKWVLFQRRLCRHLLRMPKSIVLHHHFNDLFLMLPFSIAKIVRRQHNKHAGTKEYMPGHSRTCPHSHSVSDGRNEQNPESARPLYQRYG